LIFLLEQQREYVEEDEAEMLTWKVFLNGEAKTWRLRRPTVSASLAKRIYDFSTSFIVKEMEQERIYKTVCIRTLVSRDVGHIDLQSDVVVGFWGGLEEWSVVSLQVNTSTVLQELRETSPLHRDLDDVLVVGIRSAHVELYSIEVSKGDVKSFSLLTVCKKERRINETVSTMNEGFFFCFKTTEYIDKRTRRTTITQAPQVTSIIFDIHQH